MLVKLLIYSQPSTAGPLKDENGWIILSQTLLGTWLLVHAGIKVYPLTPRFQNMTTMSLSGESALWLSKLPRRLHLTKHVCPCLCNLWRRVLRGSHGFVDKKEELLFIWLSNWEWSKLRLSYWKLWYVLLKFEKLKLQINDIGGTNNYWDRW